jgi:ankyrin repeat protein
LLDAGANPNAASIVGETPLMTAAQTGSVDVVKTLLAHGADLHAKESSAGQTALMRAIAEHHLDVVRALVAAGDDVNAKSKNRFTPLMFAAQQGNPAIAKLLVEQGADVNATAPDGIGGDTDARQPFKANTEAGALMVAIDSAPEKEALFRARRGDDGPIDTAADARRRDYEQVALFLIEHGADVNQKGTGRTPLHAAVQRSLPEVAKALIARGSNVNARLEKALPAVSRLGVPVELGATPFWLAAGYGDVEMMRILVAAGADPTLTSNDKTTPLMVAAGWNFLDGMDKYGRRWFRDTIAPVEQAALAAVKYCLDLGLDVNAANNDGETAMWGAVYLGGTAMTQLLFDHGAQVNIKSKKNQTPWSLAQGRYNGTFVVQKDTSELLLKLGADPALGELDPEVLLRQKRTAN